MINGWSDGRADGWMDYISLYPRRYPGYGYCGFLFFGFWSFQHNSTLRKSKKRVNNLIRVMRPMFHLRTYVSGFCVPVYPCKLVPLFLLSFPSFSYREIQLLQDLEPIGWIQKCMQYTLLTYTDTGGKNRAWVGSPWEVKSMSKPQHTCRFFLWKVLQPSRSNSDCLAA